MDIESIKKNIYCIDTYYQAPGYACAYLIVAENKGLLIDTGTTFSIPYLLAAFDKINFPKENLEWIIASHVHLDHVGGAGALMKEIPTVKLLVHPKGARHLIDPTKLAQGAFLVYGAPLESIFGEVFPCPKDRIFESRHLQEFNFYGKLLTIYDTPGHARHHLGVFDKQEKIFFTGDTAGLCYRKFDYKEQVFALLTSSPVQFDPDSWHNSLDLISQLRPSLLGLSHFSFTDKVESVLSQIRYQIDYFVSETKRLVNHKERKQHLKKFILDYFVEKVTSCNSKLSPQSIMQWIDRDAHISVQGLEDWLDKNKSNLF